MNKHTNKFIASTILLIMSSLAHSEAGWTGQGYLQEIQATTAGKLIIKGKLKGNPSKCKDINSYYIDYSIEGAENIYQLLLQSIASNNQVKLLVTGRCEINGMSEISSATIYAK